MARVEWTVSETEELGKRLAVAVLKHPLESVVNLLNKLQDMMSPDRRRKVTSLTGVPSVLKIFEREIKDLRERAFSTKTREEILRSASVGELLILLQEKMETRISQLEYRVGKLEVRGGEEGKEARLGIEVRTITRTEEVVVTGSRLKIGIVGLLKGQFREVEREFPALDLRLYETDKTVTLSGRLDHVILCKDFITHEWQTIAYKFYSREKVHIVSGTQRPVIAEIQAIIECH